MSQTKPRSTKAQGLATFVPVMAFFIGLSGYLSYNLVLAFKATSAHLQQFSELSLPRDKVAALADKIADPRVSAQALAEQGFYPVAIDGDTLGECRAFVLRNDFAASAGEKAFKINGCIVSRQIDAVKKSAPQQR